ncbi:MAG TPA: hypothetical protein VN026_09650, partial [Bacteroidia bacterium]|nr:hypothetical protein [Bacteroidia bacterium]
TGVEYKYLHEPNTTVTLDNSEGNTMLFRDQNGDPIGISKSEIPTSIAEIKDKDVFAPAMRLSISKVEEKLGRKLHFWNDDVVNIGGRKYKKVYLQPFYNLTK